MNFKKGDKVFVRDSRKGNYKGIVEEDFNLSDEWYPMIVDEDYVQGLNTIWYKGDHIPCRKGLSKVELREEE